MIFGKKKEKDARVHTVDLFKDQLPSFTSLLVFSMALHVRENFVWHKHTVPSVVSTVHSVVQSGPVSVI